MLDNDTKLDNPPLTYTIEDSPSVGSAAFNSDNTVALTLPSGFKGLTKFRYKVTNSKGGFSISSVTVFVDVPAYRALFAGKGNGRHLRAVRVGLHPSTKISSCGERQPAPAEHVEVENRIARGVRARRSGADQLDDGAVLREADLESLAGEISERAQSHAHQRRAGGDR